MRIQIQTDVAKTLRLVDDFTYKQVPFATALALTSLAKKAQSSVQGKLDEKFVLRSSWVKKGIQIEPARKADWPHSFSIVGSRDQFMALQAVGGIKKPKEGRHLAIPQEGIRPNIKDRIPKSKRPRQLLSKKRGKNLPFVTKSRKSGNMVVLRRTSEKRYPLEFLYSFHRETKLDSRWPFRKQVEDTIRGNYEKEFGHALARAIATARR